MDFPGKFGKPGRRSKVEVVDRGAVRYLHIDSDTIQSAMRIGEPDGLELSYTRSMMAALLFLPEPRRVTLVGLGAGSIAKFLYHRVPGCRITGVEVNADVVAAARTHFSLPADDDRLAVVIGRGEDHVARHPRSADLLMIDGYDGEGQAEALASAAFYADCAACLDTGGLLVVNLWSLRGDFEAQLDRIDAAFPAGTLCLPARRPGNVIVFGFANPPGPIAWRQLGRRAAELEARLGLEYPAFVEGLRSMNRHDADHLHAGP